jgi:hypothetical protein
VTGDKTIKVHFLIENVLKSSLCQFSTANLVVFGKCVLVKIIRGQVMNPSGSFEAVSICLPAAVLGLQIVLRFGLSELVILIDMSMTVLPKPITVLR